MSNFSSATHGFIRKAGEEDKRIVYGIVLEPETADSQGDIYSAAEIEQAAHLFVSDYENIGAMHKALVNDGAEMVESYLAPCSFDMGGQHVIQGTWIMAIHITSDSLWEQVKSGELTGLSIGGFADRQPIAAE